MTGVQTCALPICFNWDRLTNVIDVYVNHLRKKVEPAEEPRLIHAVRGAGYIIRESDETR